MATTNFAVYYYQGGRWSLHASFENGERELAIEEAKSVEFNLGYPAQVVREVYYPETNATHEQTVYKAAKAEDIKDNAFDQPAAGQESSGAGSAGTARTSSRGAGRAGAAKSRAKSSTKAKSKGKVRPKTKRKPKRQPKARKTGNPALDKFNKAADKLTDGLVKLCVSAAAGLLLAIFCTAIVVFILFQLPQMGLNISQEWGSRLTQGTFVVSFLWGAWQLLRRQFNLDRVLGLGKYKKKKRSNTTGSGDGFGMSWGDSADDPMAEAFALAMGNNKQKKKKVQAGDMDFTTDVNPGEIKKPDDDDPKKKAAAKKAESEKAKKDSEKKKTEQKKKQPEKKPAKKEKSAQEQTKDKALNQLLTFLSDALEKTSQSHPQLNAFSKFGLSLYAAGAANVVCQSNRIDAAHKVEMLRQCLKIIGSPPPRIDAFLADLDTYAANPRQKSMMNEGAKAVTEYMAGMKNSVNRLAALLTEWTQPEKRSAVPNQVTFLFTDIVGSTAMTQALGNAGAQKVVRAHNDAVRGPLAAVGGTEVKHTGDGIMATAPNPVAAVTASVQMLEQVLRHNTENPNLPLNIRIGINAGEAVAEDGDYFGAAVQITARICDTAHEGQAWVSESIVAACEGHNLRFVPRGEFAMKGIDGAKPLYEVAWTRDHLQELG